MSGTTIPTGFTPIPTSPVTTSTNPTISSGSVAGAVRSTGSNLDQDAFLKLLVAQLKYQDPSKPLDSSQFMAQTAQFTQVQKMTEMNTAMESVLALQQGLAASGLVGKTAQYTLADGTTSSGTVLSASFGVASQAEPTVRIGDKDIPLSSVTTVGTPR
jgi:flagellar basal-body rod modification protein FlgD